MGDPVANGCGCQSRKCNIFANPACSQAGSSLNFAAILNDKPSLSTQLSGRALSTQIHTEEVLVNFKHLQCLAACGKQCALFHVHIIFLSIVFTYRTIFKSKCNLD